MHNYRACKRPNLKVLIRAVIDYLLQMYLQHSKSFSIVYLFEIRSVNHLNVV